MIKKVVNSFIALFCALATASHAQNADLSSWNAATVSFQTVDKHASNLIRVSPHANWGIYRKYRLTPAVYEPSGCKHDLKPDEIRKLKTIVDRSLQMTFRKTIEAEGAVLEVRPVITSVKRTNTLLNAVGFVAIQAPISFGGAAVRYELLDGESGDPVGVISCRRNARPWNVYPWNLLQNFEALGQGSVILKSDSRRLRKDLNRLGRLENKPAQYTVKGAE